MKMQRHWPRTQEALENKESMREKVRKQYDIRETSD